jgi:hypothetical protein
MDTRAWANRAATAAGAPAGKGPLKGLAFAAKDSYDVSNKAAGHHWKQTLQAIHVMPLSSMRRYASLQVAGHITGAGNPSYAADHPPATATAPAVQASPGIPRHHSSSLLV